MEYREGDFGVMKIFGKEMNAFGSLDILIFIVIVGISGYGLAMSLLLILSPNDETTGIFGKFPLNILPGIVGISIGVFLYRWLTNQNIKNLKTNL